MRQIFITRLNMAANEDFITGDDLDDLFMLIDGGILDGDQVLNQQIESIATEIASNEENLARFYMHAKLNMTIPKLLLMLEIEEGCGKSTKRCKIFCLNVRKSFVQKHLNLQHLFLVMSW